MQLPRFRPPLGIVRNAENVRDSLCHAAIRWFHQAMNSGLVVWLAQARLLRRFMTAYREFADQNRARIDTLEFICGVVEEPSTHLRRLSGGAVLDRFAAIRDLIAEQSATWIHLETARWEGYLSNTRHTKDVALYRKCATPSAVPDQFAHEQKAAEQAIARFIGMTIGTARKLERHNPDEIGWPWVYKVALSRTFKQDINRMVARSAWNEVLPRLEKLHPKDHITGSEVTQLHQDIWRILRKLEIYDPAVARDVDQKLTDYCREINWSPGPMVLTPPRKRKANV